MKWTDIQFLYLHELRCAFRERNVLLYVVVIPALLYPLLVWLTMTSLSFIIGQSERTAMRIVVSHLPPQYADFESDLKKEFPLTEVTLSSENVPSLTRNFDIAVEFSEQGCKLRYDSARYRSAGAKERLESFVTRYRDKKLEDLGRAKGLSYGDMQFFGMEMQNLSSGQDVGRYLLGVLLPFTLIVILSLGGMYSAIDCTAGERERGTWETSLTLATSRANLIVAKYLYVSTMSSLAGMLNLVAMTFSLRSFVAPMSSDLASKISMSLPLSALPVIVLGTLTLSCLLSAVMMLFSSLARTFREGQALVSPLFLLMLLPTTLVMDKSMEFDRSSALLPVVNVALLWRESLQGQVQWDLLCITMIVCILGVAFCLFLAQWFMSQETLLLEGGGRLWKKFVPRYFTRKDGAP